MSKPSKPSAAPSWATRTAAPPPEVAPPPEDEAAAFEREAAAAPVLSPDVTVHAPPPPPPGMAHVEPDIEVAPADTLEGVPRDGSLIFLIGEPVADKPTRIPARWRRFRFYRDRRWHRDGKWVHAVSGVDVGFKPTAWEPWIEMPAAPFTVPEPTLSPLQEKRLKAMGRPGR